MTMRRIALCMFVLAAACHREGRRDGLPEIRAHGPMADAPRLYPDLAALYAGNAGIYRSCAANQGVCHNDKEYPNLATMGSVVAAIGGPCNVTRELASEMHDLCEQKGDMVATGGEQIEIGSIRTPALESMDASLDAEAAFFFSQGQSFDQTKFYLRLRKLPTKLGREVSIIRSGDPPATLATMRIVRDAARTKTGKRGQTLVVGLPLFPTNGNYDIPAERDPYRVFARLSPRAARASDPEVVHFGDPNGNGIFGAELGGGLIVPGHPERSYLMKRLTDPTAGPLMPRANCCHWSKAALRGLYCWIAGLEPDGRNAMDPIDYETCPAGPVEDVVYPEAGPGCETSGMCPVAPRVPVMDRSSFAAVMKVLSARCGDAACHGGAAGGAFELGSGAAAYTHVVQHVQSGVPAGSELYRRISPALCKAPDCEPMPLGGPPLPAAEIDIIRQWIARGAPRQ
ncbi:MAG TPA: hypothetical protein VG755_44170 [Nannocystaceae bacterium]|nr:hypothetical protein [Nannocystaceae bacterium]